MPRQNAGLARRIVRKFLIEFRFENGQFLVGRNGKVESHTNGGITLTYALPTSLTRVAGDVTAGGPTDEQITDLANRIGEFENVMVEQVRQALRGSAIPQVNETTVIAHSVGRRGVVISLSSAQMLAEQGRGAHGVTAAAAASATLAQVAEATGEVPVLNEDGTLPDIAAPVAETEPAIEVGVVAGTEIEASEQE